MAYDNPTVGDFKSYFTRDFPYNVDPALGVTDADIVKAYNQTNINMPQGLWPDQNSYSIGYFLLSAHWLVIDLRMAASGINGTYSWIVSSKSVGSVSESFSIPQRILDNPDMAMLAQTQYGAKFLQLILPQLAGQMFNVFGHTLP